MGGRCLQIWFGGHVAASTDLHTSCPFVDISNAFDTSWVEAMHVRLHQVGVTVGMWRTIATFFCGTLPQV